MRVHHTYPLFFMLAIIGLFSSLFIGLLIAAPVTGGNYKAAMQAHHGNAVVVLTTEGCSPCKRLKNNLLIAMDRAGILEDSSIVVISYQKQPELVRQLKGNGGFPQVIIFRHGGVWRETGYTNQAALVERLKSIKRFRWGAR